MLEEFETLITDLVSVVNKPIEKREYKAKNSTQNGDLDQSTKVAKDIHPTSTFSNFVTLHLSRESDRNKLEKNINKNDQHSSGILTKALLIKIVKLMDNCHLDRGSHLMGQKDCEALMELSLRFEFFSFLEVLIVHLFSILKFYSHDGTKPKPKVNAFVAEKPSGELLGLSAQFVLDCLSCIILRAGDMLRLAEDTGYSLSCFENDVAPAQSSTTNIKNGRPSDAENDDKENYGKCYNPPQTEYPPTAVKTQLAFSVVSNRIFTKLFVNCLITLVGFANKTTPFTKEQNPKAAIQVLVVALHSFRVLLMLRISVLKSKLLNVENAEQTLCLIGRILGVEHASLTLDDSFEMKRQNTPSALYRVCLEVASEVVETDELLASLVVRNNFRKYFLLLVEQLKHCSGIISRGIHKKGLSDRYSNSDSTQGNDVSLPLGNVDLDDDVSFNCAKDSNLMKILLQFCQGSLFLRHLAFASLAPWEFECVASSEDLKSSPIVVSLHHKKCPQFKLHDSDVAPSDSKEFPTRPPGPAIGKPFCDTLCESDVQFISNFIAFDNLKSRLLRLRSLLLLSTNGDDVDNNNNFVAYCDNSEFSLCSVNRILLSVEEAELLPVAGRLLVCMGSFCHDCFASTFPGVEINEYKTCVRPFSSLEIESFFNCFLSLLFSSDSQRQVCLSDVRLVIDLHKIKSFRVHIQRSLQQKKDLLFRVHTLALDVNNQNSNNGATKICIILSAVCQLAYHTSSLHLGKDLLTLIRQHPIIDFLIKIIFTAPKSADVLRPITQLPTLSSIALECITTAFKIAFDLESYGRHSAEASTQLLRHYDEETEDQLSEELEKLSLRQQDTKTRQEVEHIYSGEEAMDSYGGPCITDDYSASVSEMVKSVLSAARRYKSNSTKFELLESENARISALAELRIQQAEIECESRHIEARRLLENRYKEVETTLMDSLGLYRANIQKAEEENERMRATYESRISSLQRLIESHELSVSSGKARSSATAVGDAKVITSTLRKDNQLMKEEIRILKSQLGQETADREQLGHFATRQTIKLDDIYGKLIWLCKFHDDALRSIESSKNETACEKQRAEELEERLGSEIKHLSTILDEMKSENERLQSEDTKQKYQLGAQHNTIKFNERRNAEIQESLAQAVSKNEILEDQNLKLKQMIEEHEMELKKRREAIRLIREIAN